MDIEQNADLADMCSSPESIFVNSTVEARSVVAALRPYNFPLYVESIGIGRSSKLLLDAKPPDSLPVGTGTSP
jgi:hypothetical protein